MNKGIGITLLYSLLVLLVSCDPTCYNSVNIIADNETNKNLVLFCEYPYDTLCNVRDTISAKESGLIVSSYQTGPSIGPENRYIKLWIYNATDSTYIVCANFKPNEIENVFLVEDVKQNKVKGKNGSFDYTTDCIFTINDVLISKMMKNTAITDSIFRLKK